MTTVVCHHWSDFMRHGGLNGYDLVKNNTTVKSKHIPTQRALVRLNDLFNFFPQCCLFHFDFQVLHINQQRIPKRLQKMKYKRCPSIQKTTQQNIAVKNKKKPIIVIRLLSYCLATCAINANVSRAQRSHE